MAVYEPGIVVHRSSANINGMTVDYKRYGSWSETDEEAMNQFVEAIELAKQQHERQGP